MKLELLPPAALAKVLHLDGEVAAATAAVADLTGRLAAATRARDDHRARHPDDGGTLQRLAADIKQLTEQHQAAQRRQHAAAALAANVRQWVAGLPETATLHLRERTVTLADAETVEPMLAATRRKLQTAESESFRLLQAPVPGRDLDQRIRIYVAQIATPTVDGIAAGAKLDIQWPYASPLLPVALLDPDRLVAIITDTVARSVDAVMPLSQRPPRIAALTAEIARLEYEEEQLIMLAHEQGRPVERHVQASAAAILGVEIAAPEPARGRSRRRAAA